MKRAILIASITLNILLIFGLGYLLRSRIKNKFVKNYSVVFFGDSLTANGDWNSLLDRNDIKTAGYPGFTTSHLVWLLHDKVIKLNPDTCYIMAGVNDVGVGIPVNRTIENYTSIIDTLIKHNIVPIIQSTIYTSDLKECLQIDTLNLKLLDLTRLRKVRYIELNSRLSNDHLLDREYTTDGTHLNKSGYTVWAKVLRTQK